MECLWLLCLGFAGCLNGMAQTTEQQYIGPQNVPMTYTTVKFIINDMATKANVWTRIDKREREGDELFGNSKPKEVFERILKSAFDDFTERIEKSVKAEE